MRDPNITGSYTRYLQRKQVTVKLSELKWNQSVFSYSQFMTFLERLGRALNMEEISKEIGVDLHTESLLIRAEQLARLESDKLIDKVKLDF